MTMYVQIDNDEVVINEEKLGDVVVWAKSLNETKDMLTLLRRNQAYYLRIPNEKNEYFKILIFILLTLTDILRVSLNKMKLKN